MKPIVPSPGIDRRACSRPWRCFRPCPRRSFPSPRRRRRRRRAACCRRGTTGRRSRRSSTSCARPPTGRARAIVAPEDRIAVFDQDGTLWVEHPMYSQVVYCLDRVPAVVAKKPELKNVEPFKTVLSGNREAMAKLSMQDLEKILAATLTGMPVEEFNAEAKKWLETARHPRWNRPLHRAGLSADARSAALPARQRLQDLHRDRRRPGLRARLRRRSTASRPSRWSAPRAERNTATARTASRS